MKGAMVTTSGKSKEEHAAGTLQKPWSSKVIIFIIPVYLSLSAWRSTYNPTKTELLNYYKTFEALTCFIKIPASPLHMESNGNNKPLVIVRTPTTDVWASFYIICAFAVGLVLISLLGIMLVYRHRHKKRLQQRRQQYLGILNFCP